MTAGGDNSNYSHVKYQKNKHPGKKKFCRKFHTCLIFILSMQLRDNNLQRNVNIFETHFLQQ